MHHSDRDDRPSDAMRVRHGGVGDCPVLIAELADKEETNRWTDHEACETEY